MRKIRHLAWSVLSVALLFLLQSPTAIAQIDFSGNWSPLYHEDYPERIPGPENGDYAGIPVNDAARLRGDSYDPTRISSVTQYQCRPHGADYSMRGLANMRVDQMLDPLTQQVVAIRLRMNAYEMERTIWLDGREHPGELEPHTFEGFSTGTWNGNMLNVRTTHLKKSYLRRNGLPRSEQATFTDHWVRHGEYLTVTTTTEDPAFLTEPWVRSQTWKLDPGQQLGRDVCQYVKEMPGELDDVPHYLPGQNTLLNLVPDWYGLPAEGVRGGSQTLYPEYHDQFVLPEDVPSVCTRYCTCGQNNGGCGLN